MRRLASDLSDQSGEFIAAALFFRSVTDDQQPTIRSGLRGGLKVAYHEKKVA
jgi:hypothetical protein